MVSDVKKLEQRTKVSNKRERRNQFAAAAEFFTERQSCMKFLGSEWSTLKLDILPEGSCSLPFPWTVLLATHTPDFFQSIH